nr:hypothetical protein [Tanacetum cinerariifolium]
MEVDIEEYENEPELRYHYEEMDPLNPPSPASESEPKDVTEVENSIEHKDKTVTASTAHALAEKKKSKDEYYGKLILDLGNKVCSSMEQGTTKMEKLVKRLGNAEDKVESKKLKNQERQNKAIDVSIEDEKSPSSEREDLLVILSSLVSIVVSLLIMPLKSAPLTQAAIHRMIKESVDAAITAERARHANAGNNARGSGPVRGQDAAPFVRECTFAGFMKCNPIAFHGGKKVKFATATLQGPALSWWNAKVAAMGLETVNQMP